MNEGEISITKAEPLRYGQGRSNTELNDEQYRKTEFKGN
jgi:hypothetical protein